MEATIYNLYFPDNHQRPLVEDPDFSKSICEIEYKSKDESNDLEMPWISISNCALQYLCNIRDWTLASRSDQMGGATKIFYISLLSLGASIGYTVFNAAEVYLRVIAATVVLAISMPLALINHCFGINPESEYVSVVSGIYGLGVIGLFGAIQGTLQVFAGFYTSYLMVTCTNPHMPNVDQITSEATLHLAKPLIDSISCCFTWIEE